MSLECERLSQMWQMWLLLHSGAEREAAAEPPGGFWVTHVAESKPGVAGGCSIDGDSNVTWFFPSSP